jgi:hypothetical protein
MTVAQTPSAAQVVTQLPANPWHPYEFQEEQLKERIARQIASRKLAHSPPRARR